MKQCFIPGAARAEPEARPAAAIVNSPVCARTGLPLSSVQFIKVTEVCHENASRKIVTKTKLPQKSMLRAFAKASVAANLETRSSSIFDVFCWSPF